MAKLITEEFIKGDGGTGTTVTDAKFGKEFGVKFGANERKVLLLLASNPSLSAENIAEQIGLSKRGVEKQLKKFRDLGIITRKGSDKTGYWKVVCTSLK